MRRPRSPGAAGYAHTPVSREKFRRHVADYSSAGRATRRIEDDDTAPKKQKRQNVFEKGAEEGGAVVMGALETLGKATHIGVAWEGLTKGFEGWKTPDDVFAKLQER